MNDLEHALITAAARRLGQLDYYPRPVDIRRVRIFHTAWLYRIPGFRRFHGYELGAWIFIKAPLDQVSENLIVHELTHVWQHQHRPLRMWLSYLRPRTFGKNYNQNPYEQEARRAAQTTQ
jgi:hypothetical protein